MLFKFPSIRHFSDVIKEYRKLNIFGKVKLVGYPKVHGSNTNVCFYKDGGITVHTKELKLDEDNNCAEFYQWVVQHYNQLVALSEALVVQFGAKYPFTISGEWGGGNIQSKASTAGIDKFWVPFMVANVVEETDPQGNTGNHLQFLGLPEFHLTAPDMRMFDVREFGKYEMELDVAFPELCQNALAELTTAVEAECPVAKYFGIESSKGEGVVWHPDDFIDRHLFFKVKGHKHSTAKVRTLASVDAEKVNSILEFVEYAVTENRMEQAVKETGAISKENMSGFLKWLNNDIIKEDTSVLETSGLTHKAVSPRINSKAIGWYKSQYV